MKARKGTTLLELLITTVCLGSSAVAIMAALRFSNDRVTMARYQNIAQQYLVSEIERDKASAVQGTLASGTSSQTYTGIGLPGGVTISRTVTPIPGTPDLMTLHVTASYGIGQSMALDTIVRLGDIN